MKLRSVGRVAGTLVAAAAAVLGTASSARAQQSTFHLDRLEVPGAPQDGIALFRPTQDPGALVYGQLALGYSRRPLHTSDITNDAGTLSRSSGGVIDNQFSMYASLGIQLLDRLTIGATLPVVLAQGGQQPEYGATSIGGSTSTTTFSTSGAAAGDMRVDLRFIALRSKDRTAALGVQGSLYVPTGNGSTTNFGGDGESSGLLMVTGEYKVGPISLVGNTGIAFRPKETINDPTRGDGLGIGDEWRWAVGAFLPLKKEKYRLGATIFGQTGLQSGSSDVGDTAFTRRNTPIEWQAEGRMRFLTDNRAWVGLGLGSLINPGYGAPDFRAVALIGYDIPILNSTATSPERKKPSRYHDQLALDSDHDGIPDDIDACPSEPEDHLGSDPSDGCPLPPDRDGDGIPDQFDKCPDQPEDKDGIEDEDGCPETDFDTDGIPDAEDACPKEPGKPNKDPKKNGCPNFIRMEGKDVIILQQVHFATGKATILPDSFPILQEIADLLRANANIKKLSVEGHTDDRGGNAGNLKLSQSRTESVVAWLTAHGTAGDRLEAHGFGEEKPIADNTTEEGRTANRRVEFKIVDDGSGSGGK